LAIPCFCIRRFCGMTGGWKQVACEAHIRMSGARSAHHRQWRAMADVAAKCITFAADISDANYGPPTWSTCRQPTGARTEQRYSIPSPRTDKVARHPADMDERLDMCFCGRPFQAAGRDAKRRKQYPYHPRFREIRESTKYVRLLEALRMLLRGYIVPEGLVLPDCRTRPANRTLDTLGGDLWGFA